MFGRFFKSNGKQHETPRDAQGRRAVIDIRDITKVYNMGDIEVHALESARYLMGIPRSTEVSASMFQNFKHLGQAPITTLRIALLFHPFSQRGGDATKTSWAGN